MRGEGQTAVHIPTDRFCVLLLAAKAEAAVWARAAESVWELYALVRISAPPRGALAITTMQCARLSTHDRARAGVLLSIFNKSLRARTRRGCIFKSGVL